MTTKMVTGREIYEAIEKDGYGVLREDWMVSDGEKIYACILGQAGLNLGVLASMESPAGPNVHELSYEEFRYNNLERALGTIATSIIEFFDAKEYLQSVAEESMYQDKFNIYDVGWDAESRKRMAQLIEETSDDLLIGEGDDIERYLHTWAESVAYAKKQLELVWDTPFEVTIIDYSQVFDHWTPPA